MFDLEFYPTPPLIIEMMTSGLDLTGKTVLEPSAGSGNIIDWCKHLGANVIACETHKDLQRIVASKCKLLKPDFFEVRSEEISHIDFIIMNPPFSNADKHIKHAWDIAPEGCEIIALCNSETLSNRYSRNREVLGEIISNHGNWQNLGNAFSEAERKTDCNIALVKLFKPKIGESEFDAYFFNLNEDQEDAINGSGIMKHNDIREIVNRYVGAVKMFDTVISASDEINSIMKPIAGGLGIAFGAYHTSRNNQFDTITRDTFKKELQKSAWRSVFNKMNMDKYVTRCVMSDINKFVEQQQHIPFTMQNVYKMIELIIGTHSERMERVLVEAFDHICSLSSDNSEAGEKWKTNSNYKINRRFIDTYICEYDARWPKETVKLRSAHRNDTIDDIVKALCHLTGKSYEQVMRPNYKTDYDNVSNTLYAFTCYKQIPWGQWVQWNEFFRVRGYKKGTMHFEFVDENVWMEFNRRVSKIKGWVLPRKTDTKHTGKERTRKTGVEVY
jgi:hypothetical protein